MKTRLLLTTLILLLAFSSTFAQESNPNFKAPQTWITDECGSLYMLPTFDYNEFINYGGYAYSDCGIVENSLTSYYYTYYDEFLKKLTIETVYEIEDSCGNRMQCTDYYLVRPSIFIPHNINVSDSINSISDIDSLTGLPYSDYHSQITAEQFTNAGGFLSENCYNEYPDLKYYDLNLRYNEKGLPINFIRIFVVFDPYNGLNYEMTQYIDFESSYPTNQTTTIIPPQNVFYDECNNPILPWISNYQEFTELGGLTISECGIIESSFSNYHGTQYDEYLDKIVVSSIYAIEDLCGNYEEYWDVFYVEPFFEAPKDINSNSVCGVDEIENLTGLPYSTDFNTITKEQFENAGGLLKDICPSQDYYIVYSDYPNYYQTCPFSFTRYFHIMSQNGIGVDIEQQITLEDVEPPVLTAPTDTVVNCLSQISDPFSSFSDFELAGGNATDNCILMKNSFRLINETREGACSQTITRTYEIQDTCGNTATADQVFLIIDENPPFTFIEDVTIECSGDIPPVYSNYNDFIAAGGLADDDCGGIIPESFRLNKVTTSGSSCIKTIEREYEISDLCDNISYFTQTIRVVDTIAPIISGIDNYFFECDSEVPEPFDYIDFLNAGGQVNDNCDVNHDTFRYINESSEGFCPRIIKRTYEVEDSCGNIGTWEHKITIHDTVPPHFITLPQPIADIEFGSELPPFEELEFTDNCETPVLAKSILPYTENEAGYTVTYLWKLMDKCENTAEITVSFNVLPKPIEYCSISASSSNQWIKSVSFGDQTNTSGASGYFDYTNDFSFNLETGLTTPLTLVPDFSNKATFLYWRVWIDLNNDGEFASNELVFSADKKRSTVTGYINIPTDTEPEIRMRIVVSESNNPPSCGSVGNGEVEDYKIVVSTPEPQPPVVAFSSDKTIIGVGETVQFYDESLNNPDFWEWILDGSTQGISYQQNPIATYDSPGTYGVFLTVLNSVGHDSIYVENYITVTDNPPVVDYCESQSLSSDLEWISLVNFGGINNSSTGSTYSDFTSIQTSIQAGSSNPIYLSPGFNKKSQREYWKVWIDFNQDGDFDDLGEEVFSASNARSDVFGDILIPDNAQTGITRMRVSMKANSAPGNCEQFDRGEVEDYSLEIITPNKSAITSVSVNNDDQDFLVYPNPVNTLLNIQYNVDEPVEVKIYNTFGATILISHFESRIKQINVETLANGVYFLELTHHNKSIKTIFVKQ